MRKEQCDGCGNSVETVYAFDWRARWGDVITVWLGPCCAGTANPRVEE